MKLPRRRFWVPLLLLAAFVLFAKFDIHYHIIGWFRADAYYRGLPTSYWRDAATLHYKGPPPWRETLNQWARVPLPSKDRMPAIFRRDPDAVPVLMQFATDEALDEEIRRHAIHSIGQSLDRRDSLDWPPGDLADDVKVVLQQFLGDAKREIRFAAAVELLRFEVDIETSRKIMLDVIAEQLKDRKGIERTNGIHRLPQLVHSKLIDPALALRMLGELENDPDGWVRRRAAEAIEGIRRGRELP